MANFEIPFVAQNQKLTIALAGITYQLTLRWNVSESAWVLDIADNTGNALLNGIPLITGTDLLAPYAYMNFGGQLIAFTDNNPDAPPTYADLGSTGHVYFETP